MRKTLRIKKRNRRDARQIWSELPEIALQALDDLTDGYAVRVISGDLLWLANRWYITHAGLLRLAQRRRCFGIRTHIEKSFCDPSASRWVFKAIVYKSPRSRGFVGHGDADPSNVSPKFRGSELRIAETRAVNRALRKALGIGLCSFEELGWTPKDSELVPKAATSSGNRNGNGTHPAPRLRDRLCLLIRQHRLDPALVKSYAADFCGTPSLHLADRERLEAFVSTLSDRATNDRDALLCKLNSYTRAKEAHS